MTTTTIAPPDAHRADADRLLELVAVVQATQRAEDADGFLALFDPDAIWVSGGGVRLVGLDAIGAFTRKVLPGAMAELSVTYDVTHVQFLSPDLALTCVEQEYLTADGEPLAPRQQGRPTYTWRRTGDDWLIVNGQNTGVPVEDSQALSADDETALREIVARVEQGFNDNDADLLVGDIAEDALVVNAVGAVLRGREEVESVTRSALAGSFLRDATAYYELSDLALLGPDVAVAHKSAWSTAEAAGAGAPPEMNAQYVFARRDGRWWIVRRQNTLVPTGD